MSSTRDPCSPMFAEAPSCKILPPVAATRGSSNGSVKASNQPGSTTTSSSVKTIRSPVEAATPAFRALDCPGRLSGTYVGRRKPSTTCFVSSVDPLSITSSWQSGRRLVQIDSRQAERSCARLYVHTTTEIFCKTVTSRSRIAYHFASRAIMPNSSVRSVIAGEGASEAARTRIDAPAVDRAVRHEEDRLETDTGESQPGPVEHQNVNRNSRITGNPSASGHEGFRQCGSHARWLLSCPVRQRCR